MTEDEAKEKWCPMVRVANSGGSYNRNSMANLHCVETKDVRCIGAECMMWRVHIAMDTYAPSGYCGLAGRL